MRFTRLAVGLGLTVGSVLALAAPAFAVATATGPHDLANGNPVEVQENDVTPVTYSGQSGSSTLVQFILCNNKSVTAVGFSPLSECTNLLIPSLSSAQNGTYGPTYGVSINGFDELALFNGQTWACASNGTTTGTAVVYPTLDLSTQGGSATEAFGGSVTVYDTCQLIVTRGADISNWAPSNPASYDIVPLKFLASTVTTTTTTTVAPPTDVPEAPLTFLLPATGLAAAAGAYFIIRRRPAAA